MVSLCPSCYNFPAHAVFFHHSQYGNIYRMGSAFDMPAQSATNVPFSALYVNREYIQDHLYSGLKHLKTLSTV